MSTTQPTSLAQRFPNRADYWLLRSRTLGFSNRPLLMGIVNVTPDSFSEDGTLLDPSAAIDHGLRLANEGAEILDIGGESTRPYSDPVSPSEQLRRVLPVVSALCEQSSAVVSIDTSSALVAREAIAAGCQIVNDVTGLEGDPRMIEVAAESNVGVCAMHMQGTPRTMQDDPQYDDVVRDIGKYLQQRRDALIAAGIESRRICLDPGVGFGKTHQHNLTLLAGCGQFHSLGCPLLVGHSRKGFIGIILGDKSADRTAGTIGVALALASRGVQIIRVHSVAPVAEALLLYEASGGIDGRAVEL